MIGLDFPHTNPDIDWAALCEDVARIVWGKPSSENNKEIRWGTHGARKVDLEKGVWYDHESNTGGGTIDLVPGTDSAEKIRWLQSKGLVNGTRKSNGQTRTPPPPYQRPIATTYRYVDETGTFLFEVVRFGDGLDPRFMQRTGPKKWGLGGARRVLYRLPEVVAATAASQIVFVVEGEKDADNLRAAGFVATTNPMGADSWIAAYSEMLRGADVVIIGDNDDAGRKHVAVVAGSIHDIARRVRALDLAAAWPDCPEKGDISDWLEAGHNGAELEVLVEALPDWAPPAKPAAAAHTLEDMHAAFRGWFGDEYDMDAADAIVVAAVAESLAGDPLWLLIISGPGAAKTETVQALSGCGAYITSTIQSEGALLSASGRKDRSKTATGGLLRKIGDRGILVIKDVTSILSSDRNVRASVLAAIREIYDGRWERNVGTDGGQTLTWTGRIAIVGAVITAWDAAHAVVSAMGDRFVLLRIDLNAGRKASGMRAIRNTGEELQMRQELAEAVGGCVQHANIEDVQVRDEEVAHILNAADIVTLARTAVERDYAGEIINAHAPEMPTRFAKQLTQMLRGGIAIGMSRERALRLVVRCARESIPPLRLEILLDVARNPRSRPGDVRERINKPWRTTKREMEALHMLGLLHCTEEINTEKTVWRYSLADGFDRTTLLAMSRGSLGAKPSGAHDFG